MGDLRLPPPLWMLAFGALQHRLVRQRPSTKASRVAGGAVAVGSAALLGAAGSRFHAQGTTTDPFHVDRAEHLVTTGANAYSRNPMYVGMAGALVAHAAWRRSILALLPVAGFVALMDRTQVAAEERALRQRFGAEYDDYCRRVPRWLGPA